MPIESTLEKTRRFPLIGGWSDALSHLNNNYRKVDWNQILGNLNEDDVSFSLCSLKAIWDFEMLQFLILAFLFS